MMGVVRLQQPWAPCGEGHLSDAQQPGARSEPEREPHPKATTGALRSCFQRRDPIKSPNICKPQWAEHLALVTNRVSYHSSPGKRCLASSSGSKITPYARFSKGFPNALGKDHMQRKLATESVLFLLQNGRNRRENPAGTNRPG